MQMDSIPADLLAKCTPELYMSDTGVVHSFTIPRFERCSRSSLLLFERAGAPIWTNVCF